jgi:hypothetical protein
MFVLMKRRFSPVFLFMVQGGKKNSILKKPGWLAEIK